MTNPAPKWRRVAAFLLDLIGSFFVFGYGIALATGNTTGGGFNLDGG